MTAIVALSTDDGRVLGVDMLPGSRRIMLRRIRKFVNLRDGFAAVTGMGGLHYLPTLRGMDANDLGALSDAMQRRYADLRPSLHSLPAATIAEHKEATGDSDKAWDFAACVVVSTGGMVARIGIDGEILTDEGHISTFPPDLSDGRISAAFDAARTRVANVKGRLWSVTWAATVLESVAAGRDDIGDHASICFMIPVRGRYVMGAIESKASTIRKMPPRLTRAFADYGLRFPRIPGEAKA